MTLDTVLDKIKSNWDVSPIIGTASKLESGEYYVTLVAGGIKLEGESYPEWHLSPTAAMKEWYRAFQEYAKNKRGILHWRKKPELVEYPGGGGFQVNARLIIC